MSGGIPLGWRVPFSERADKGFVSHLLVHSRHPGLAQRACMPGVVVNPAIAYAESRGNRRCKTCERIEAKQQRLRAAA